MLWDDVLSESTPENIFFSRLFRWIVETRRMTEGFGYKFQFILDEEIFDYYHCQTVNSKAYRFYKSKPMLQTFDSSDQMTEVLSEFFSEISAKNSSSVYAFVSSHELNHEDSTYRVIPTFSKFKDTICQLSSSDILQYILDGESIQYPAKRLEIVGNKYKATLTNLAMREIVVNYRRSNINSITSTEKKELEECEKLNREIYRETAKNNDLAIRKIELFAGFPYSPTRKEYKRFVTTNFKNLVFKTVLGRAEIKISDIFEMLLFPVPIYRGEIISMQYPM